MGTRARQKLQSFAWNTCLMQQFDSFICDQWRLVRWFCENRIACRQSRSDLAREDRQREVPRADAGESASRWCAWRIGSESVTSLISWYVGVPSTPKMSEIMLPGFRSSLSRRRSSTSSGFDVAETG